MDVKYLGDGSAVITLGEGQPYKSDDGKGNLSEHATTTVLRIDPTWLDDIESEQLLDARPELHPDTGRPLSDTQTAEEKAAAEAKAAPEATYSDNHDGTYTRDTDGAVGVFTPEGFREYRS